MCVFGNSTRGAIKKKIYINEDGDETGVGKNKKNLQKFIIVQNIYSHICIFEL